VTRHTSEKRHNRRRTGKSKNQEIVPRCSMTILRCRIFCAAMQNILRRDAAFFVLRCSIFFCDAETKLNGLVYSAVQHDDSAVQHDDSAVQNCRSRPPRWKSSDPPDGKAHPSDGKAQSLAVLIAKRSCFCICFGK